MPIAVTCPTCHARMQVSEKFAGKKGPCPKCKGVITIPKLEQQVKIDDRAHGGAKDAAGKLVLKPIERKQANLKPLAIGAIAAGAVATIVLAWVIGSLYEDGADIPWFILAIGAWAIGVPVSAGGYAFLRNDELEPHSGLALWLRSLVCSTGYLALWLLYYWLVPADYRALQDEPLMSALAILPFIAGGAVVALASFDLGASDGAFHYALYLVACIALCLVMGWPMIEQRESPDDPSENAPAPILVPQFGGQDDEPAEKN